MAHRFNYQRNQLLSANATYDLDVLREWLLLNAPDLCKRSKIKTIYTHRKLVTDTVVNSRVVKREVNLAGEYMNTYDWDGIFFKALKSGLIENFINNLPDHHYCNTQPAIR